MEYRVKKTSNGGLRFHCPGCDSSHVVGISGVGGKARWDWNGSFDKPTLNPSVLVRVGHYVPGRANEGCWCDYNRQHPEDADFECIQCHSFVRDGKIEFLSDCSHALAGKTVDLPPLYELPVNEHGEPTD